MKNCYLIYNPISSSFKNKVLEEIIKILTNNHYNVYVLKSEYKGHIEKLIKQTNEDNSLVLTLGGDGTVGEVVKGYQDITQKTIYSHISTGTTNDMALNLGLAKGEPIKSMEMILNGKVKDIDTILVNNIPVAYVSAFGFLSNVTYETNTNSKKILGHNAYILKGIKSLLEKPNNFNITYKTRKKEEQINCLLGIVSNSKGFGGIRLYPSVARDDGQFEVLLLKELNHKLMLELANDYFKDSINLSKYKDAFELIKTDYISFDFKNKKPEMPINIDGDLGIPYTNYQNKLTYKTGTKIKMLLP